MFVFYRQVFYLVVVLEVDVVRREFIRWFGIKKIQDLRGSVELILGYEVIKSFGLRDCYIKVGFGVILRYRYFLFFKEWEQGQIWSVYILERF